MISSSQRPLPDNTQHSQQTDIHAPVGFEPTISAGEWPQTYAFDCAATGTGILILILILILLLLLIIIIIIRNELVLDRAVLASSNCLF